jgi:carbonic anhydrase
MADLDHLLERNRAYVDSGAHTSLPVRPARRLAVVTCMDARIDVFAVLGLALGDAHVMRTAGGRVTDDVLRSLTLSSHLLGTRQVAVIAHTDCGLRDPDGDLADRLRDVMGHPPTGRDWGTFADPADAVADDCRSLLDWDDRPYGLTVAGYVLNVTDGSLDEVAPPTAATDPA